MQLQMDIYYYVYSNINREMCIGNKTIYFKIKVRKTRLHTDIHN